MTARARVVLPNRTQMEFRASDLESLLPEGHRARLVWSYVAAQDLGPDAQARFINLKAWRSEVAKAHDLPAYVIFHDTTLVAIAQRNPTTLQELQGISGIGASKLDKYGQEVLRVIAPGTSL